jgi:cytochrome c
MRPGNVVLAAGILLVASVILSAVHPWGDLRSVHPAPILEGATIPSEVRQTLEAKCADCHSNNTHWPAYSRLAPGSWLMERDIAVGREHLNMSQWSQYDTPIQIDLLSKIASEARTGGMPVKQYTLLHPKARLSDSEAQTIYEWARAERKRVRKQSAPPK